MASLAIPPGPKSLVETCTAVLLLLASGGAFFLNWSRLPATLSVLVPLTYTASVLMLILSARSVTSGIGIVVLMPVMWTALYHRRWESAVVVAAVVGVEVITSLTPIAIPTGDLVRRVVFWALLASLASVATHDLRARLRRHVSARDELLRQTLALEAAAEELTATLDPAYVVARAVRLAAELVSPPGTAGRRAQYCRVEEGMVALVEQYDETGEKLTEPFPVDQHPHLSSVLQSGQALSVRFDAQAAGPTVREIIDRLGISESVYVPVLIDGQVDGVLAVSVRGAEVTPELFEQCKALGHLVELALNNAVKAMRMHEQAATDSLTNLPNRRGFEAFIASRPGRRQFVIMVLDVDGLKQVNDSLGHRAGDNLLVHVAEVVRLTMRRGDVLARMGGDEFAAYLFEADVADACRVAERMLEALISPLPERNASASIGIAMGAPDDDAYAIFVAADAAMYRAKRAGGRRYEFAPSMLAPSDR